MVTKRRRSLEPEDGTCRNCGKRHRIITTEECIDRSMPENVLQSRVVGRAKHRKWWVAHAGKGWVGNSETGEGQFITPMHPGWPDLFLLNPNGKASKVLAIELKRELGVLSEDQEEVLALLNACGIPAVVVRPSDLRLGRVNAILEV